MLNIRELPGHRVRIYFSCFSSRVSIHVDARDLKRAHVVITTYDTLKSEYNTYVGPDTEGKGKAKAKKASVVDSDSSDAEHFGRTLQKNAPKKSAKAKKEALFKLSWFRIILGEHRQAGKEFQADVN